MSEIYTKSFERETLRRRIARAAGFSRQKSFYFDKVGDQLNATHKVDAIENLINQEVLKVISGIKKHRTFGVIGVDLSGNECIDIVSLEDIEKIEEGYRQ